MDQDRFREWRFAALALAGLCTSGVLSGAGIPEPGLVIYGQVRYAPSGARLTIGSIQWTFQSAGAASPVTVSGQLTNINDQFSFVLLVPIETPLEGRPASSDTLVLDASPQIYDRTAVTLDGQPLTFADPSLSTLTLARTDRGKVERIDLVLSASLDDSDGNGLPDTWERVFLGRIGVDPHDDADGDGLTNTEEFIAGTDPADPRSQFRFIRVNPQPGVGVSLEWSSVVGHTYTLLRSASLLGPYTTIQSEIAATPPVNVFLDTTATGPGLQFYRLSVGP